MNKLHILQTPSRFYPTIGGVESHALNLSRELVKIGNKVKVICSNEPKSNIKHIDGIEIERINYLTKITNTNITLSLPSRIFKSNYDIIHTHMPTPWSADISILMGKIMRKKTIITIHNDINKTSFLSKIITEIYLHTIFLLSLYLVDRIIVVNEDWQTCFSNTSNILKRYKNKISILPNGVDTDFFKPLNIPKEKNSVLFVSLLDKHHKYKGIDYLLDAIKITKKTIPDIKLIIVGEGELKNHYINKVKKLGIEKYTKFLGEKKQEDLVKLYNKSSVFVLPSTEVEGFGIVAIEAMACKTPVVVTNIIGVARKIKGKDCGIIVKPKSPIELAVAMIKILKNKKIAKKLGENGRKLVEEKYTWNIITTQINQLYNSLPI